MMRFLILTGIFITGSACNLIFSQGVIKGKVLDANTLEPLHGVYVIYGRDKGTATDTTGSYTIQTSSSQLTVSFQFIGYTTVTRSIKVPGGGTVELNISMNTQLKEIGQIVVSAGRTEQKIAELTVSMDVLKTGDFTNRHITNASELMTRTPGIDVLDGQASIRGGTGFSYGVGSRVLALIDGLPVLSPDAGNIKWQFLPLENISQIEIIKGASSVLYGSSALNGVINFRTAAATKDPETNFFAETGAYGKPANKNWVWWDSPRIFSTLSFSHLRKAGNNDIGVGINFSDNNGYRKFNDETLGRLSLRFRHYNTKVKGLTYGMNFNGGFTKKRDFILWENATDGALKQDTSSVPLLNGSFIAFDPFISFNNNGKFKHDLRIRVQSVANRFPVRSMNNSDATSVYAEYQTIYTVSDHFNVTAGLVENYNSINSNLYGDHTGLNIAGFAQAEAVPLRNLKFVAGLRLEHNSLDKINDRLVPIFRTGLNWKMAENTYLRASFGQGYRYPSVAEKHASTTLGAVNIYPNPELEPESGWNTELGLKQGLRFGNLQGLADVSAFFSQNEDMIEYILEPASIEPGFKAYNVEQSRIYGAEAEFLLAYKRGRLEYRLGGGYTYIYPVRFSKYTGESSETYLKYRRKHSLKISADAAYGKFETGIGLYYKSKILNIDEIFLHPVVGESILPGFPRYWEENNTGYFLADFNAGYRIAQKLTLSLAVKNLTNTEYMGRPGDIQPQRNYSLRLSGKF